MRILIFLLSLIFVSSSLAGTQYYVATGGDDEASGLVGHPWETISKVNSFSFAEGDDVAFNRGDTWTGTQLYMDWCGNSGDRAVIGAYGTGANPIIDGNFTTPSDFSAGLIYVVGGPYVTVENIKIINSEAHGLRFHTSTDYGYADNVETEYTDNAGILWSYSDNGKATGCTVSFAAMRSFYGINASDYSASTTYNDRDFVRYDDDDGEDAYLCIHNSTTNVPPDDTTHGVGGSGTDYWLGVDRDWPGCLSANHSTGWLAEKCTVFNVHGEGIGVYKLSHNSEVKECLVYNAEKVGIYIGSSHDCNVHHNFVYGTTNTDYHRYKSPINQAGEGLKMGDEGHVVPSCYDNTFRDNVVVNCGFGINTSSSTYGVTNIFVFNNTFINARYSTFWVGYNGGSGSLFQNNISYPATDAQYGHYYGVTSNDDLTWSYNSWSTSVIGDRSGTGDVVGNPDLAQVLSYYNALTAGSLAETDVALTSVSPCINVGADLGDDYDDGLSSTSIFPDTVVYVDKDPTWDIGAIVYTGGVVVDDPTTTVIKIGWADEAAVVAGGGKFRYTLQNTEWVATIGADNAITTAFLAGITGSLSCATCWNSTVKANHDDSDVTRVSATVLDIDFNAEPTYDITENEQIDTIIPAIATVSGEVINANVVQIAAVLEPSTGIKATYSENGAIGIYNSAGKIGIYE